MEKNDNKKVLLIIFSLALVVFLVTASYAYHVINSNNENPQTIDSESAKVEISYTDCASSNTSDCANISANLEPGESISKTFEIENTGTLETEFTLYFKEIKNTFVDDELVYKIEDVSSGEVFVSETPVPYNSTTATNVVIKSGNTLGLNEVKQYKITITFLNTSYDQAENDSATFSIKLGIKES